MRCIAKEICDVSVYSSDMLGFFDETGAVAETPAESMATV